MSVKKYFIAIVIPGTLYDETEAIKQSLFEQHHLKGALRSPAHITLHRPFEWKEEKENLLIEKLQAFSFKEPFEIVLKDFDFFEPRVIYANVVKNDTMLELHRQLKFFAARELKLLNELNDERGFHPHVTVAFRDLKKPLFYTLKKEFENKKLHGTFVYTGFWLLKLEEKWEAHHFFAAR